MKQLAPTRRGTRLVIALSTVVIGLGLALAAWRFAVQRLNLVVVNQSGVEAQFSWQPSLFAASETVTVGGCESKSIVLLGGEGWRLTADGLDINEHAVDRPWLTPMIAFEIWLDPGGSSRRSGPRAIEAPVDAPHPAACVVVP